MKNEIWNKKHKKLNMKHKTWNMKHETWNMKHGTWNKSFVSEWQIHLQITFYQQQRHIELCGRVCMETLWHKCQNVMCVQATNNLLSCAAECVQVKSYTGAISNHHHQWMKHET